VDRYVYNMHKCILELHSPGPGTWDTNNVTYRSYLWQPVGLDVLLATTSGTTRHYYTHDGRKNTSELLTDAGAVAAHYQYCPFGQATVSTGGMASVNPFRFSSERYDPHTNLIYYNYRHYSPMIGRWLGRDPLEEKDALNLLLFAANNPVCFYDIAGMLTTGLAVGPYPVPIPGVEDQGGNFGSAGAAAPTPFPVKDDCSCAAGSNTGVRNKVDPATLPVNGCGPETGGVPVPEDPVPIIVSLLLGIPSISCPFTPGCNSHDTCYGDCTKPKSSCDLLLYNDLMDTCDECADDHFSSFNPSKYIWRSICHGVAGDFYLAVSTGGGSAHDAAQAKNCEKCCCK
jgi:RHS repeat-associated protein